MDDERLSAELQRRASAPSPRPDWARHDLLPGVSREIDARPQPVVTSRWSPRLGVAAVVAALLVMVIAVPRLVPTPPTSSSSPTLGATPRLPQTGVLSTAEFASRLAAGQLDGESVLVDGRIGPNLRYGRLCAPSGSDQTRCYMGPLEGVEPPIDVEARWIETNDEEGARNDGLRWEIWHFPSTPQEGFLLLSVDVSRHVEFVGLARDSGPGPAWSVADADAQHLDINTVGADEVILVRGWLVETEPPGTTISIDCTTNGPRPLPVEGLPYNYCLPQDYLSSEPPVDELLPEGAARLSVQRNAAQLFGARIQDGTSLFAIAPRLYGGCFDAPTCWQWDVVARVDPIDPPLPAPTPRTPRHTFDCGLAPLQVIDETGLVEACAGTQAQGDGMPVTISNPDGDPGNLEFIWGSVPACGDGPESLTLRPRAAGYELLVVYTRTDTACDGVVYETRLVLRLSEPIPAETVIVSMALSEPSPSPQPSPPPSPPPAVVCSESDGYPIGLNDHSGLIVSCEAETDRGVPTGKLAISVDGPGTLLVTWPVVLDNCTPMQSLLELWSDQRVEGHYVLAVRMSNPNAVPFDPGGPICDAATGVHTAHISLSQGVLPSDIDLFQTIESPGSTVGSAWTEAPGIAFEFFVTANGSEVSSGEAIDASSSLRSNTDVTVMCSPLPVISLEQLDGPLAFYPEPIIDSCSGPRELHNGESLNNGFLPAAWGSSDPNPLDPYIRDGKLFLPPGTYRFVARVNFAVGEGHPEDGVQLEASIIVRVTPAPTVAPTASPNLTARERIDSYWLESDDVGCMGMLAAQSLEEVAESSDLIVVGRPIGTEPWVDSPYETESILINFDVSEVIKGTLTSEVSRVIQLASNSIPPVDLSDIDHVLLLSASNRDSHVYYPTEGYMSIYANVNGRVVTPEFAAVKQTYGNHLFSTALDGIRFDQLLERVRDAANSSAQQRLQGDQRALFAC